MRKRDEAYIYEADMRIVRMVKIKFDCSIKRVDDTQHNGTTYTFYSLQMNDQAIFR